MKQMRRLGFVWTKLSKKELRVMAARVLLFMLMLPFLMWGLTRIAGCIVRH